MENKGYCVNKNLLLIHGAWSTKHTFNYIIKKVLDDCKVGHVSCFEYDCQKENITSIVHRAEKRLKTMSKNGLETVIVGHSLGGLISLKLSQHDEVSKTITLSSPLSGLKFNRVLHAYLLYYAPVLKDLLPDSKFIKEMQKADYSKKPIDIVVSLKGFNPLIFEPSDGVVTVESQLKWTPETATVIPMDINHTEILLYTPAISLIEKSL